MILAQTCHFFEGLIAEKFGKVECFFFSAICFGIGMIFTFIISFSPSQKKDEPPKETDKPDEEETNKVLLKKF